MFRRWLRHPKILLAVAATALLLATVGGVSAWMYRQARNKQLLLNAAAAAEQAGDWATVESALRRYASLHGDDAEICQRIGQAIQRGAADDQDRRRAVPFLAKAVGLDPKNDSVRLQFAELLVDENPVEAAKSADIVLQTQPDSPAAWCVKALALVRMLPGTDASEDRLLETQRVLDKALGYQPGHLRLASAFAEFSHRNAARLATALGKSPADLDAAACAALDRAVEQAEDEAEARLTRVLFRRQLATTTAEDSLIKQDLERLVELRPASNVIRLLAAGRAARQAFPAAPRSGSQAADTAALADAKSQLEAAVQNRADDPVPYWSLAQLQWWSGEREAAVKTLEQGRQAVGADNVVLNLRLAELQLAEGQWADAKNTLQTLNEIIADAEQLTEAASAGTSPAPNASPAAAASDARPTPINLRPIVDLLWVQWWLAVPNPEADPQRALPVLDRYTEDSLQPGMRGLAIYLRGLALASLSRWDEAAETFLRAVQFVEGTVLPRLGVAHAYYRLGRYREAVAQYRYALDLLEQRKTEQLNDTQIWIEVAHGAIAEQSQQPAWNRDWKTFQDALAHVRERLPKSPIPLFLELEAGRWNADPKVRAEAEARLPQAEREFGQEAEFWGLLAAYRLRTGDVDGAEQAIQSWEQKAGQPAGEFRAELAQAKGDWEAADRGWQAASAGLSEHRQRQYLTRRVQLAMQTGRSEQAREWLAAWSAAHPGDALSQFELAQIAWAVGDVASLKQAAEALQKLEGAAGRRWRIVQVQALLLDAAGKSGPAARDELQRACAELVAKFPEDRQVRVLQGLVAEATGQPREAVKAWRQAVAQGEQNPGILLRLAGLLYEQGQSREALELCLTVASSATDCRAAMLAARILTTAVVNPNDVAHAEEMFQAILDGPPRRDLPVLLLNLAVLREYQGRPDEAVALTRKGLELQPEAAELKNNLAWFLTAYLNDQAAARTLIDQAIQAVGPLPSLLDTQGVILMYAAQPADAIRVLESCTQGDAVPASRLLHLAEAYLQGGRKADAQQALERAEKRGVAGLSPRDRRAYLRLKALL